jgi:Cu-Zn family superoxide dismutase
MKFSIPVLLFSMILSTAFSLALSQAPGGTSVTLREAEPAGPGDTVGTIVISETSHGLVFAPDLKGLPPGLHGFHVHENPNCDAGEQNGVTVPALAAGGHYDPKGSKKHGTPWGDGHLGDLPPLYVDTEGRATQPVLAPRLKLKDVKERALMVHVGGDNHADHPKPMGGGGGRMACGVIR